MFTKPQHLSGIFRLMETQTLPAYATTFYKVGRDSDRFALQRPSTARLEDGAPRDVVMEDVSQTGCRISGAIDLSAGDMIRIGLAGIGAQAAEIMWADQGTVGCRFDQPLSVADLERTRSAQTLVEGIFPTFTPAPLPSVAVPAEDLQAEIEAPGTPRLRFRARIAVLFAAAFGAWGIVGAIAYLAWRLIFA